MKKIILILTTFSIFNSTYAQSASTIEMRLKKLELNNDIIQKNLYKAHKQYRDGLGMTIFGIGATIMGSSMSINDIKSKGNGDVGFIIGGTGVLMLIIGNIIMIDSHKYIGRAGLGLNKNGITYTF